MKKPSDGTVTWNAKFRAEKNNERVGKFRTSITKSADMVKKGQFYESVIFPEGEPRSQQALFEWIAENVMDFVSELIMCYQLASVNNPEWAKIIAKPEAFPNKGFPDGVQYKWKEGSEPAKELRVDDYVTTVLKWAERQTEDEDIFPSSQDVPYADNTIDVMKKIFSRLFRVYAIIYQNPCLCDRDQKTGKLDPNSENARYIHDCFKRFLYFGWEFELLNAQEVACIAFATDPLRKRFDLDRLKYENRAEENI